MADVPAFSISLAYVLPIALLALLLTRIARRSHLLIIAVLATLPAFYVAHYQLLETVQGWPSDAPLPEAFELIAFDIEEPRPGDKAGGEILLWVNDRAAPAQGPRVHRLGYSRSLHESLVDAGERQRQGQPQVGRVASHADRPNAAADMRSPISFSSEQTSRLPEKTD